MPLPVNKPRIYRRFRRSRFGELFQHESSIHQWWPGPEKQTLLPTLDEHSGLNIAGRFVPRDTTWAHFLHFHEAFERFGIPQAIYTDGLSLFGPSSSHDHLDPRSEFQRALRAIGVAHLVAPSLKPKAKSNADPAPSRNASSHSWLMQRSTLTNAPTKSSKWKSNAKIPKFGCMTKIRVRAFFSFLPLKIVVIYTTYAKPHHRSTSCSSPPTPFPNRRPRSNPPRLHHRTIRRGRSQGWHQSPARALYPLHLQGQGRTHSFPPLNRPGPNCPLQLPD